MEAKVLCDRRSICKVEGTSSLYRLQQAFTLLFVLSAARSVRMISPALNYWDITAHGTPQSFPSITALDRMGRLDAVAGRAMIEELVHAKQSAYSESTLRCHVIPASPPGGFG